MRRSSRLEAVEQEKKKNRMSTRLRQRANELGLGITEAKRKKSARRNTTNSNKRKTRQQGDDDEEEGEEPEDDDDEEEEEEVEEGDDNDEEYQADDASDEDDDDDDDDDSGSSEQDEQFPPTSSADVNTRKRQVMDFSDSDSMDQDEDFRILKPSAKVAKTTGVRHPRPAGQQAVTRTNKPVSILKKKSKYVVQSPETPKAAGWHGVLKKKLTTASSEAHRRPMKHAKPTATGSNANASPNSNGCYPSAPQARESSYNIPNSGNGSINEFYQEILEWNFYEALEQETHKQVVVTETEHSGSEEGEIEVTKETKVPLPAPKAEVTKVPSKFSSYDHYLSVWKPLAREEVQAQAINNVLTERPVAIAVTATSLSAAFLAAIIKIRVDYKKPRRPNAKDHLDQLYTNDLVLLTSNPRFFDKFLPGAKPKPPPGSDKHDGEKDKRGILAIVSSQRNTREGLILMTIGSQWRTIDGEKELYLFKVNNLVTSIREYRALCDCKGYQLMPLLLSGRHEDGSMQLDSLGLEYVRWLRRTFNESQLEAITAAATSQGFTLIKGPPGTGKTTTLKGLLNSLHLREYSRYYNAVLDVARRPDHETSQAWAAIGNEKPHILVTAPSNAAVDNIVAKVIEEGFCDGEGRRYFPQIVRVGRGLSATVRSVGLDDMVDQISSQPLEYLDARIGQLRYELAVVENDSIRLRHELRTVVMWIETPAPPHESAPIGVVASPPPPPPVETPPIETPPPAPPTETPPPLPPVVSPPPAESPPPPFSPPYARSTPPVGFTPPQAPSSPPMGSFSPPSASVYAVSPRTPATPPSPDSFNVDDPDTGSTMYSSVTDFAAFSDDEVSCAPTYGSDSTEATAETAYNAEEANKAFHALLDDGNSSPEIDEPLPNEQDLVKVEHDVVMKEERDEDVEAKKDHSVKQEVDADQDVTMKYDNDVDVKPEPNSTDGPSGVKHEVPAMKERVMIVHQDVVMKTEEESDEEEVDAPFPPPPSPPSTTPAPSTPPPHPPQPNSPEAPPLPPPPPQPQTPDMPPPPTSPPPPPPSPPMSPPLPPESPPPSIQVSSGMTKYEFSSRNDIPSSPIVTLTASPPLPPSMDQLNPPVDYNTHPRYRDVAQRINCCLEKMASLKLELQRYEFARKSVVEMGKLSPAVRQSLEVSFLDTAHIVFTTLSSAGVAALDASTRYDVLVVDEAAQAVELSTIIPMKFGSRQCVLVGDPQQLSATTFSRRSGQSLYERSLFERLESCGHPVHMLRTQYRSHPVISTFPRNYFYGGKLQDGPNVLTPNYIKPYHSLAPVFKPLVFWNLLRSRETTRSVSRMNAGEAHLAVNLYLTLRNSCPPDCVAGKVGVITPYSQQLEELRNLFRQMVGDKFESEVEINTVDGFQGREKDIIILSTVRADPRAGVGFLNDIRRMNVSLTRAKFACYVIGSEVTLRSSKPWAALLDHSYQTGCIVHVENPKCNLLRLEPMKKPTPPGHSVPPGSGPIPGPGGPGPAKALPPPLNHGNRGNFNGPSGPRNPSPRGPPHPPHQQPHGGNSFRGRGRGGMPNNHGRGRGGGMGGRGGARFRGRGGNMMRGGRGGGFRGPNGSNGGRGSGRGGGGGGRGGNFHANNGNEGILGPPGPPPLPPNRGQ